jgi:hypothetical protein
MVAALPAAVLLVAAGQDVDTTPDVSQSCYEVLVVTYWLHVWHALPMDEGTPYAW